MQGHRSMVGGLSLSRQAPESTALLSKLKSAIQMGDADAVRAMIGSTMINVRFDDGFTPLTYATLCCRPSIVSMLCEKGANVNERIRADQYPVQEVQNTMDLVLFIWSMAAEGTRYDNPRGLSSQEAVRAILDCAITIATHGGRMSGSQFVGFLDGETPKEIRDIFNSRAD